MAKKRINPADEAAEFEASSKSTQAVEPFPQVTADGEVIEPKPVETPAAPPPVLPRELLALGKSNAIPADIEGHVLAQCQRQAAEFVERYDDWLTDSRKFEAEIDPIRLQQRRDEMVRNLSGDSIADVVELTGRLVLLSNENQHTAQLRFAVANHQSNRFARDVVPSAEAFGEAVLAAVETLKAHAQKVEAAFLGAFSAGRVESGPVTAAVVAETRELASAILDWRSQRATNMNPNYIVRPGTLLEFARRAIA